MSQLMSSVTRQNPPDAADHQSGHWYRLQEERRFRVEQLAALDAELAANQQHHCLKLALRIAATTALDEIDAALARMAEGRYGLCVNCAQPIPAARLDALPRAPLCMQCHFNEQNCHLAPHRGGQA
jgi:RNA polymerase-binding transcription factor DksA